MSDLVRAVDQPSQDVAMEFLPVKHADPARLTQQVDQLLKAKLRTQGGGDRLAGSIETGYDARTNTIVVIAPKDRMDDAQGDRAVPGYGRHRGAEPDPFLPAGQHHRRRCPLDHSRAWKAKMTRDPGRPASSPGGDAGTTAAPRGRHAQSRGWPRLARECLCQRHAAGWRCAGPAAAPVQAAAVIRRARRQSRRRPGAGSVGALVAGQGPEAAAQVRESVRTKQARVTADPHTNSIIVAGPPDVQRLYEQLIRSLDKRRPQVLIECTIVTLDTTDNFNFGVEIGKDGGAGSNQLVTFSSFGLSTPNPQTGRLTPHPRR